MNVTDFLIACLEQEGVEYVFGLPDDEVEEVVFSHRDSNMMFVPVRHEQGVFWN